MESAKELNPSELPRGVAPAILLEQVRNTAPFIFQGDAPSGAPHWQILRRAAANPGASLSHAQYFELCLAAHHATVATFVPTDVDNQIRFRLWYPQLPSSTLEEMAEIVLKSRLWDPRSVSTRYVVSAISPRVLSGHDGEWFSTAVGAYAALRKRSPEAAARVQEEIFDEIAREAAIFHECLKAKDGVNLLKASTLIAHNLGDLDRVLDMWKVPDDDPVRAHAYKAGHEGRGPLVQAGQLNKALMADENHRHFALRKPKCLRVSSDLLLPFGPFLDAWGATVARHPQLSAEDVGEVAEALVDGWNWLFAKAPKRPPTGYARALAGMVESFPGGLSALAATLPSRIAKQLQAGPLHQIRIVPRPRFEEQWRHMALKIVA